ncbi:MAG: response regulator, partial [Rhizobiales bacterium]|nr:response regulator [Hyphomicrobiales bacterium]
AAAPAWLIGVLGVLAAFGLLCLFAWIAGFIALGSDPQQRAFFDALMDSLPEACVVTDGRGRAVYANAQFIKLVSAAGISRLVGVENLYAGYPDAAEKVYRLAQAAREGQSRQEEFRLAAGSAAAGAQPDRPVWIRVSVVATANSSGETYAFWRHQDITADREKQERAFAHLQYIISYLDRAPAGFFSATADGRIAYANATLAGWLGLGLEETTGGSLALSDIVSEAGIKLLAGVAPKPGEELTETFDLDLSARDGQIVPVRIIHRVDYDASGNLMPSRSLILARSGEEADPSAPADLRLSRLFNNAPIGIAEIDEKGVIRNANLAFISLSARAQRGAALANIASDNQRRAVGEALEAARAGEGKVHHTDIVLAGPSPRSVQFVISKASGRDSGFIVYALDTTENKALESHLAQSQKMQAIGQLAGGVAHDFNNVLTAIIGFSDLLLAKHRPTDPAFADIMNIKQNANRAANLVRQLLAFSRRQTLRPEVLSLTDVLSDLGNLLGRLLGEKIELKVVHGRELGLVKVDINQFEQVVINLAVNARDAMPNGGTLTVRTSNVSAEESQAVHPSLLPAAEYVLCEVIDTGTGIPPEILDKIWEPFFSTKEVGKGTGLGLSTVYGIIKQTGGFIFCTSKIGKGTTFSIFLPRHRPNPAAEAGSREDKEEKKETRRADLTGKGTILLVEDEDAVRAFASRALASRGYTVLEADSGARALEIVTEKDGGIDLVISDVVMPEMDGPTLLKELRKRGVTTKIIFISGYAEDAFQKNLEGEEDFAFLPKPFSLKQLAEAVKDVMGG